MRSWSNAALAVPLKKRKLLRRRYRNCAEEIKENGAVFRFPLQAAAALPPRSALPNLLRCSIPTHYPRTSSPTSRLLSAALPRGRSSPPPPAPQPSAVQISERREFRRRIRRVNAIQPG